MDDHAPPDRPLRQGPPPRPRWHRIGYVLTILWLVAVLVLTRGDQGHPLYEFIFIVPLAAWIAAMIVDRLLKRRTRPQDSGGP